MTNSRALPGTEARELISTICRALQKAAAAAGRSFEIVLRGDSTLRGHFPDEPEAVEEVLGQRDIWVLAPYFRQGGRFTIDDVHYVANPEGMLVPAAQTPFAQDKTFGYANSNLRKYVAEKTKGKIGEDRVHSISLEDIRTHGSDAIATNLSKLPTGSVVIVNAVVDTDMEVAVSGILKAHKAGKTFLFRTAAAFVSTRLGIDQIPPLQAKSAGVDISSGSPGGLVIAGSYVPKTTAQLKCLIEGRGDALSVISLNVEKLLENREKAQKAVFQAADEAGRLIDGGKDVLVMTSRKLITGHDELSSLKIGSVVADSLVLFLRLLIPRPRYIIAKGGITSSDAATKGLAMKRARVRGQAAPGVPLWHCTERSSKFSGITYVVFPGNVGDDDTLCNLVANWACQSKESAAPMQYQRLGRSGLKVSQVILGCMTFGNPSWEGSPWVLDEERSLPLLKAAYDQGINTWETANSYSNGQSERIISKAMEKYSIPRRKLVIMTKLYYPVMDSEPNSRPQPASNDGKLVNQMGLSRKHIYESVEASLQRLGTSYIDILLLHRLDRETEPVEIMRALHDLVQMGKVLYIGASSMYCWEFARLQYIAKARGWTTFSAMSGLHNLLYREEEREMIPFCQAEGIGLLPWSPIARGLLARPSNVETARSAQDIKTKTWFQSGQNEAIIGRVQSLASQKGCKMTDIAIAWVLHKGECPIMGLNSIERIQDVSAAFNVVLSADEVEFLEELYKPLAVQAI